MEARYRDSNTKEMTEWKTAEVRKTRHGRAVLVVDGMDIDIQTAKELEYVLQFTWPHHPTDEKLTVENLDEKLGALRDAGYPFYIHTMWVGCGLSV